MIPLITQEVVYTHGWVTMQELAQLIAISQMTPGPIAVSAATYIGYKTAGILGATLATVAVISPAFIIVMLLAKFYHILKSYSLTQRVLDGIKPVVVFLIAAAGLKLAQTEAAKFSAWLIAGGALMLMTKTKIHPISIIIFGGVLGILLY